MNRVNKIGLTVAGITLLVLVLLLAIISSVRYLFFPEDETQTSSNDQTTQGNAVASSDVDTDGDGLVDLVENIYSTDPNNPDTDGDGTLDGQEILQGRDPLRADQDAQGAGDILLGDDVTNPESHTQRYLAGLPSNLPREEVLSVERLDAYISVNQEELLPELEQGAVEITEEAGVDAIAAYLDAISPSHNSAVHSVTNDDINAAFRSLYVNGQDDALDDIIAQLQENVVTFEAIPAPAEVAELHRTLVAASRSLLENTKGLQIITQDFVGGLIAAKNIEDLGVVFQDISDQVIALEEKYGLE